MKRVFLSCYLLALFLLASAQEGFRISKPESSYANNILSIKYDITGCGSGEYIDITLVILNSGGDTLRPQFISGDMGKLISCGLGKKIEWNLVKDSIKIDEEIEIMVLGRKSASPTRINIPFEKGLTRGNVILSSVFIPGLGQKKASGKASHLIFSGIVYGTGGASFYFNLRSKKLYKDYENALGDERDRLYDQSVMNFDLSRYLLFGAAGSWVTNFIWSAIIPIKKNPLEKMNLTLTPNRSHEFLVCAKWNF